MIPLPLEEQLMKMPELEENLKEIHHDLKIESSVACKDKFCLGGTNENGDYMTIWFDSYEFLKWIDLEKLEEIKTKLIKTIKKI